MVNARIALVQSLSHTSHVNQVRMYIINIVHVRCVLVASLYVRVSIDSRHLRPKTIFVTGQHTSNITMPANNNTSPTSGFLPSGI